MQNKIDLDELERLAKKVGGEPWKKERLYTGTYIVRFNGVHQIAATGHDTEAESNASYIAAANPAVILELIRMVRER